MFRSRKSPTTPPPRSADSDGHGVAHVENHAALFAATKALSERCGMFKISYDALGRISKIENPTDVTLIEARELLPGRPHPRRILRLARESATRINQVGKTPTVNIRELRRNLGLDRPLC